MNIAFRVDSSEAIGTGHCMRCLTLALKLQETGLKVIFVCRKTNGNLINLIERHNFKVIPLNSIAKHEASNFSNQNIDLDATESLEIFKKFSINLVILDHYFLSSSWEALINKQFKLMCISDYPSKNRLCDILLDSTLNRKEIEYKKYVKNNSILMTGLDYLLLRDEFIKLGATQKKNDDKKVKNILVTMGGSDPDDFTAKIIKFFRNYKNPNFKNIQLSILVGGAYNNSEGTLNLLKTSNLNFKFYENISSVATLMRKMDLIICSAGTTLWECFAIKVPTISVMIAENQESNIESITRSGASIACNTNNDFLPSFEAAIEKVLNQESIRKNLIKNSSEIIDGQGSIRVANSILSFLND